MMKRRIVVEQDPETGDWAAWCPELPGCASAGVTEEEAMENIREAIKLYLELTESFIQQDIAWGLSGRE